MNATQGRYWDNPRQEMARLVSETSKVILDVGCNTGTFGASLKQSRKIEIWGIEPNPVTAEKAQSVLDHVICGFFSNEIDLPDSYFDAIVMNDVLEHMPDPWAALHLAKRKLAPNGTIIASIPNIRQIDNLLHIIIDKDFRYEANGIRDSTHLRFFTRISAIRLFEECGFEIQHIEGIHETWWTKSLLRRLAYRIFPKALEDTKYIQYAFIASVR